MAESGGQDFSEMEEIDVNQVMLIQSWIRGALVRKWMRQVQNCYQQVVTDIEKDSTVWVDWQTEGLSKPKVTRRKRTKLPKQGTRPSGNLRDQSQPLHPQTQCSDQVNLSTSKLIANKKQIQTSVNKNPQRISNVAVLPTEYLQEETGFSSVETQTSLIEIHSNKSSVEEDNEKVLAGIDTSWLDRVKASREHSVGEEDLHLDLDSERESLRSRYSDTSENLSQKDKGFSDRRERSTKENDVQDIELIDSFSDRSVRSEGSSTSLKERISSSRSKPVEQKDSENSSTMSDRPEESQRSYRSNRSDKSDGMRSEQSDKIVTQKGDKHKRLEDNRDKGERSLHSDRSEKSQRSQRSDTSAKSRGEKHKKLEIDDDDGQRSHRSNGSEGRKSDRSDKSRRSRVDRKQMSDEEEGQRSHRSDKSDDLRSQKSDRSQRSARSNKSTGRQTPEWPSDREPIHVKPRSSTRSPVPTNHHPGKETAKGDKSYIDQEPRTMHDSTTLTNVTSVWDSFNSVLESHEFTPSQSLPQDPEKLRELRKNVSMELLWVQQAIQSRKNYLRLKGQI